MISKTNKPQAGWPAPKSSMTRFSCSTPGTTLEVMLSEAKIRSCREMVLAVVVLWKARGQAHRSVNHSVVSNPNHL